jgi:thymidylate synthase
MLRRQQFGVDIKSWAQPHVKAVHKLWGLVNKLTHKNKSRREQTRRLLLLQPASRLQAKGN